MKGKHRKDELKKRRYFVSLEAQREAQRCSTYYEWYKGVWSGDYYREDSIYIDDDDVYRLDLDGLLVSVVPEYDPFGETPVTKVQWDAIVSKAKQKGGELLEAVMEDDVWARENYRDNEVFTIIGL